MEVDIELAYTKNSSRDYEIISDFDIQEERTDKWDYDNGSPRKFIYGRATISGGNNQIKIHTVNGNVYFQTFKR